MSNNKQTNNTVQYSEEEIKQMSYWQLWGLRRKAGITTFVMMISVYAFLLYIFFRVIQIFASKDFNGGKFTINYWSIPICIIIGLLYWFIHEWYYKNVFLKNNPDKVIK